MIKSKGLIAIAVCLMVGIMLGLMLSGWTHSVAAEGQGDRNSIPDRTMLSKESAVGEAVPSAAHLSLWEDDFETMLPLISKDD